MISDSIHSSSKNLEEEFFARQSNELIERFREQQLKDAMMGELSVISGIRDGNVLESLHRANVTPSTLLALTLIPLVHVAWSDGDLDDKERNAILEAAAEQGLSKAHAAFSVLESWLQSPPSEQLFTAWRAYVDGLRDSCGEASFARLHESITERAKNVAEATGGFLGLGRKISPSEQSALEEIERAFALH